MAFDPNPLFFEMCEIFAENYTEENKVIICNEGGSRSSKTWDAFHFIYTFCDHNRNQNNDIYILRETLVKCRDFTFKDFKKCMKVIGARLNYVSEGAKPYVNIFGNNVYFRGLDDEDNSEGYPSDIIFVNESLETAKSQVAGLKMRCRKLMIMDWNPKFTDHWCFDLEGQQNVFFTRTNYTNNKHLQKSIIKEIESYEPWLPGSYEVVNHELIYEGKLIDEKNQPPPHPVNVDQGTADAFRWKVYGLGLRGAMKGVIFNQVEWIDEFPDIAYTYGNDFGFTTDPNALVKYAEDEYNIWIELLWYSPVETAQELSEVFEAVGVERNIPITCDSSDKYTGENKGTVEMVSELREMGWLVSKVKKKRSIMYGLTNMRNKKIHIVKNHLYQEAKKERENYRFKEVHGIAINQPIDKYNHMWDGARYAHTSHNEDEYYIVM